MTDLESIIRKRQDEIRGYPLPQPTRWERFCEFFEDSDRLVDYAMAFAMFSFGLLIIVTVIALGIAGVKG